METSSESAEELRQEPTAPPPPRRGWSFSLRELMIVAVIIALVMVAMTPWYQRRRILADVARVRADLRSLATAAEAYYIDNMNYATCGIAEGAPRPFTVQNLNAPRAVPAGVLTINSSCPAGSGARRTITFRVPQHVMPPNPYGYAALPHTLTTPVAYIARYPHDPFADSRGAVYGYFVDLPGWIMWSPGPDRDENAPGGPADIGARVESLYSSSVAQPSTALLVFFYDPTNGVHSDGDIIRVRQ